MITCYLLKTIQTAGRPIQTVVGAEQQVEIEDVEADVTEDQHQEIIQPADLHSKTDTREVRINYCLLANI